MSYFAGDGNAAVFSVPTEKISDLLVPSIVITDEFKNVLCQRGEGAAMIVTADMKPGRVVPLNSKPAMDAAGFGVMHKLPLADSIIFATAQRLH